MGRPSKNKSKMTGQELDMVCVGKRTFAPWKIMKVGDWFTPIADASVMACMAQKRNKTPDRKYVGVQARGLNCVVRIK
jgi:hypothetical protein